MTDTTDRTREANSPKNGEIRDDAWTDDHLFSNDGQVWDEWISLFASRDEMAEQYALELSRATSYTDVFWVNINAAIVRRWSRSALLYIKREAWRIHPNRVRNDENARTESASPASRGMSTPDSSRVSAEERGAPDGKTDA